MNATILALCAAAMLSSCATPGASGRGIPTPDIASPADGVVISVDSSGLADVRGFTLRANGGSFTFALGDLENATEFTPAHLAEHQATSEPVRVHFRVQGGERVVYRLEDAPQG